MRVAGHVIERQLAPVVRVRGGSRHLTAARPRDDRAPVFYVTPEFFSAYMAGQEGAYPAHLLWLRNIYGEPAHDGCNGWTFWQYAGQGLIDGITGPVDLNAYCGDGQAFNALRKR